MPSRPSGVTDTANAAGVTEVSTVEMPQYDMVTTLTADPGAAGTTLAVTSNTAARWPTSGVFKLRIEREVVLVTAGAGTNSLTVTRAQDGTAGATHAINTPVYFVAAVQRVSPIDERLVSYRGRAVAFSTPGRAAVGQKIFGIHNATGSGVTVRVNRIIVDTLNTAVKAVTIKTPQIKVVRFTAVPTGGTALAKIPLKTGLTSASAVTAWGDASADGTLSATTLTLTPTGTLATIRAPRVFTAVAYEPIDTAQFLIGEPDVELAALEGLAVFLDDAVVTTGNPATDLWTAYLDWDEYTVA